MNELENKIEQLEKYIEVREQEIEELQESNEKLHKELDYADNYNIYLISRIDKAVEYINHEIFKRTILVGVGTKKYTRNILDNVLNILQGDNK